MMVPISLTKGDNPSRMVKDLKSKNQKERGSLKTSNRSHGKNPYETFTTRRSGIRIQ